MAFLLRTVTNPKWVKSDWMQPGDVPADALSDLRATDNKLSVWSVQSDAANLDVVLTALAAHRERLDKIDYTLIDDSILPPIPIDSVRSDANTPYVSANPAHMDLIQLSVNKIARLAHVMMPLHRIRVSEKQVKKLLMDALRNGYLDRDRIKPDLLSELEPAPNQA